jgi:acetyltransferase-like isoleucine patch superfamily enzyme
MDLSQSARNMIRLIKIWLRSTITLPGNLKAKVLGARFGRNCTFSWGARILTAGQGEIVFGNNCRIMPGAIVAPYRSGSIVFGDNCSINPFCVIYGHGGLKVGNNVRLAAHTTIIPANHLFELNDDIMLHTGLSRRGINIGNNVWIGSGVRILDGVEICDNTIVGAGAVVTKSIKEPGVYGGVPAKLIKYHKSVVF